jgi:Uma2 family endonuclease
MSVHTGLLTVEEFLKLPEPKEGHIELHHGEVVIMPPPKWGHQRIQRRIQGLLMTLAGNIGVVAMEMAFQPTPQHEVWQADVGFVRAEREEATADDEYLRGAPDLVVEVLSPSNTMDEIDEKMSVCMDNGCISFWVVDPKRKVVSVTEGDVTKRYRTSAAIPLPEPLTGTIEVAAIFG